jgi:hypothetical protein
MMHRLFLLISLSLGLLSHSAFREPSGESTLHELVAAERAFAALSVQAGMDSAFVTFLDKDAIILRPGPVIGPKWIREHPAPPIRLSWEPDFAAIAQSGDLGYTSGPWTVEDIPARDRPPRHGSFVSVWRKLPGRPWRVVFDIGISHAERAPGDLERILQRAMVEKRAGPSKAAEAAAEIRSADSLLARHAASSGYAAALLRVLSASARLYRHGRSPAVTPDSCAALIQLGGGKLSWTVAEAAGSASGDLGWSYGAYTGTAGDGTKEDGYYMRVWQKGGGTWRVVLDIQT